MTNKVLVSEKQLEAIKCFFDDWTEDILFGWAARWGKSETIGIILAIVLSAFPGSAWLIARTVLADLKATTLNTFHNVIKRFGYDEKSYRDKIRDERHIDFVNGSKLYVIQVNYEPNDQEFDRIWSYWYTWWFLDEWQQMSNKVREVLQWRLSELDGSFSTEVPMEYKNYTSEQINPGWEIEFNVVWQTVKKEEDRTIKNYVDEIVDKGRICYITRKEILRIPYTLMKSEVKWWKLIHTYSWSFKWCIFTWCNPWTNFTRTEFYYPYKKKTLPSYMRFIPSRVGDNPWVDRKYVERLERLPETSVRKQRLLYWNFDFDDNPNSLFDYKTLEDRFNIDYVWWKESYLTVDVARLWKDKTEIARWEWLHLVEIISIDKADLVKQVEIIEGLMWKYNISIDKVIVDEIWTWSWVVDMLGCKWFVWNSQPLHPYSSKLLSYKKRNYQNLRTQAFYYLQKYINQIVFSVSSDFKEKIIEELLTVKEKDVVNDTKLQIVPKSDMKEEIWRSPDLADTISMRMYWLIRDHYEWNIPIEDIQWEENKPEKTKLDEAVEKTLSFRIEDKQEELEFWAF